MNLLPNELISFIFELIKLTDKRNFSRTCKKYNEINEKTMSCSLVNDDPIMKDVEINCYCVERFTLELYYDGYCHLISDSYINKNNKIIVKTLAMYGNIELLEIAKNNGCYIPGDSYVPTNNDIWERVAKNGNLEVLKWAHKNNVVMNWKICAFAAEHGHIDIVKWAIINGYIYDWKTPNTIRNFKMVKGN
jgi:hypothetical protein